MKTFAPLTILAVLMSSLCAFFVQAESENIMKSTVSADARIWIESPLDGQKVSSPFKVTFGSTTVDISPAGNPVPNSGHHHLLINLDDLPGMDMPLAASAQVIHFGKGQTETQLELEPGTHSLQLLLGNYMHVPHARPLLSQKITIIVD